MTGYQKSSILLVEDNDDHAELIDFYIHEVCQETVETRRLSDGEEAMNFIQGFDTGDTLPSFVFLDLKLPKYDGHEVLKAFKKHALLKIIPIIVFTTSNSRKDIKKAYENGANSYILKPTGLGKFKEIFEKTFDYWSMNEREET